MLPFKRCARSTPVSWGWSRGRESGRYSETVKSRKLTYPCFALYDVKTICLMPILNNEVSRDEMSGL